MAEPTILTAVVTGRPCSLCGDRTSTIVLTQVRDGWREIKVVCADYKACAERRKRPIRAGES